MSKRFWILGAGASISHANGNFPSINDFFKYAKKLGITMSSNRTVKDNYKELAAYIFNNLGYKISRSNSSINIEELLTLIQLDKQKIDTGYIRSISDKTLEIINEVICKIQNNLTIKTGDYDKFKEVVNNSDTIITFNWDTLLDNVFERQLYLKDRNNWKGDNQYLNFLSNLSSLKETTIGHLAVDLPYSSYNSNKGYLLKLHGSIDWFYCANQNCRAFDKAFPLLEYSKDHYCSECHSIVKALIIPPVLYKNYNEHSIIQILWNTAEREINLAEDILFWGYSLPYTDFYSNWLLRKTKPILNSITIIDPGVIRKKDPPTLNFQFIRHLISPIKNKMKEKKIILYEYFNDYLENNSIEKKYPLKNLDKI